MPLPLFLTGKIKLLVFNFCLYKPTDILMAFKPPPTPLEPQSCNGQGEKSQIHYSSLRYH